MTPLCSVYTCTYCHHVFTLSLQRGSPTTTSLWRWHLPTAAAALWLTCRQTQLTLSVSAARLTTHSEHRHHHHHYYNNNIIIIIMKKNWRFMSVAGEWSISLQCTAIKKTPLNKYYYYFQYISIFFYEIFTDYSGHNLPLLLRILSSQHLLFRNSTCLNI